MEVSKATRSQNTFGTGMYLASILYDLHELLLALPCLKKDGQKVNAELHAVSTKHAGIEVFNAGASEHQIN